MKSRSMVCRVLIASFLYTVITVFGLGSGFAEEKKYDSSEDVIVYLVALEDKSEKVKYLLHYAREFMKEEKYKDAKELAEYVLDTLDKNSAEAKELLQDVKKKIEENTMPKVNPVKMKY